MACVVLVEFVTPGRFQAGMFFPFISGYLSSRGVETRWLRFGGERGFDFASPDLETLRQSLNEQPASHLLFSHCPADSVVAFIRKNSPNLALGVLDDDSANLPASVHAVAPHGPALDTWISLATNDDVNDLMLSNPRYDFETCNELAQKLDPIVFLLGDRPCVHYSSLQNNELFAQLQSPDLTVPCGCIFCVNTRREAEKVESNEMIEHRLRVQLEAIAHTHPRQNTVLRYRVLGFRIVEQLLILTRAVLETRGLRGVFLIDARADQLVRRAKELRQAAIQLGSAGHRLEVCSIGIESFAERQLNRFGTGYGPEVNLIAIDVLRRLEADHPAVFGFSQHQGVSTILFDPWTTLSEIALNFAVVRWFRLEQLCGNLLTTRLRLEEGLPLTLAARSAGLLLEDGFDDPLCETARLNFYPSELPWRFADPRIEVLSRLLIRMSPAPPREEDALEKKLIALVADEPQTRLDWAERLLYEVATCEADVSVDALLSRSQVSASSKPAKNLTINVTDPEMQDLLQLDIDVLAFERGLKPVMKLEGSGGAKNLAAQQAEITKKYPAATQLIRRPAQCSGREWEIFVSFDSAQARQAVELTDRLEVETAPEKIREGIQKVGELLGYPRCCAQAYAESAGLYWDKNEWLWLRRRLEAPDNIAAGVLHPLTTSHIPCRLDCPHSIEVVSAILAGDRKDVWNRLLASPALIFLDRLRDTLVFQPLEPVSERWRYVLAADRCDDPRRLRVAEGEILELEPGLVRILRHEREFEFFTLDCFVWWKEKFFFRDFWRQCLTPIDQPIHEELRQRTPTEDPMAPRRLALRKSLHQLLDNLAGNPKRPLSGFTVVDVSHRATDQGWGELIVTLQRQQERLEFFIAPRDEGSDTFARSQNLELRFARQTPPDTREKELILRLTLKAFDRWISRHQEELA